MVKFIIGILTGMVLLGICAEIFGNMPEVYYKVQLLHEGKCIATWFSYGEVWETDPKFYILSAGKPHPSWAGRFTSMNSEPNVMSYSIEEKKTKFSSANGTVKLFPLSKRLFYQTLKCMASLQCPFFIKFTIFYNHDTYHICGPCAAKYIAGELEIEEEVVY